MSMFALTMMDAQGDETLLYFDNLQNQFFDASLQPCFVSEQPAEPEEMPYVIRIYAGKGCNYRCKYCLQNEERASPCNKMGRRELVQEILRVVGSHELYRVQLWGGEPFLHFDAMQEFATLFKEIDPSREYTYTTSTNGSFLHKPEVRDWCLENIHVLQISWDGPGQHLRGPDPLDNPATLETIAKMQAKRQNSIVFNPVMNRENRCLLTYRDAVEKKLGHANFRIGPARLLLPFDDASAQYSITEENELQEYSKTMQRIMLNDEIPQWDYVTFSVTHAFFSSGGLVNPTYCPGERERFLIIDEAGNVLTCANTASESVDEYGEPFGFGHIKDIPEGGGRKIPPFTRLEERRKRACVNCFVYPICLGGCPRIPGRHEEMYCRARFAETVPTYVHLLYLLTGKILKSINAC